MSVSTEFANRKARMSCARAVSWLAVTVLLAMSSYGFAENWPHWRGPQFNGSAQATGLPTEWSRTENIAWTTDLPGASAATPIVWGDHVFVSSDDAERDMLVAICIDRRSGKTLWQKDIRGGVRQDTRSTYSAPSPATDGKVVIFFYGNGDLVAYDFEGTEQWRRDIQKDYGPFAFNWTFSTSPLLHNGKLYLQVLQRDTAVNGHGLTDQVNESYLLALEPATGEEIWRRTRSSQAREESREAFTTPVPHVIDGKEQLLIIGGDDLTGHDLETGAELWRWGTWNPDRIGHWRHVPSPVAIDDTILVCAPKRDPIYAIQLDGNQPKPTVAWVSREQRAVSSDVPTPAVHEGDFIVLSDVRKMLSRVNPLTGKVVWQLKTPGTDKYEASPTVADDKIYLMNFVGTVVVVDAETGKIISNVSMDDAAEDAIRSSIVVSGNQLLIRTNRKLYCVGKN